MKPKTMILMVVAVGCGLGASYMTSKLLADRNKAAPTVETVPVLVAKSRVASWQAIKDPEKYFEVKQYPQDVAPKNAIGDFSEIKDQRLRIFLEEGKPVTRDDLVSKELQDIAVHIQPGQRATAIKVNAESLAGGFILPGSRVDVVCTVRGGEQSSRVILQNMLVLAVDQVDGKNAETKTILGQTVTLAATPEEGGRLSLAASMGELRLWLRNPGDQERIKHLVVRPADLDKPAPDHKNPKDQDSKIEEKVPPTGTAALELPKIDEKKDEEATRVAKEEEVKAKRRQLEEDERQTARAAAATKQSKTHVMFIREGSKERKEQVRTKREDETTASEDDEEEGGSGPAPVKKEEKAGPASRRGTAPR